MNRISAHPLSPGIGPASWFQTWLSCCKDRKESSVSKEVGWGTEPNESFWEKNGGEPQVYLLPNQKGVLENKISVFIFFFLTNNMSSFYLETEFSTSTFVPRGFGEMFQWIKGLLCKREFLNLDPKHWHRNRLWWLMPVTPAPGSRARKIPGTCLTKPV